MTGNQIRTAGALLTVILSALAIWLATFWITEPLAARWSPGQLKWTIVTFLIFALSGFLLSAFTRRPLTVVASSLALAPALLGLDAWMAFIALIVCAITAGGLVLAAFRRPLREGPDVLFALVIGLAAISTVIFLTSRMSIHTPLTYSIGIILLVAAGLATNVFADLLAAVRRIWVGEVRELDVISAGLAGLVVASVILLALYSRLPVVDNDSMVMHLRIALSMQDFGYFRFTPDNYLIGYFPAASDWLFGFGAILAGEYGAKAVNLGFAMLTSAVVVGWLNFVAGQRAALVGAALFISAPIIYFESITLFVENYLAFIMLAAVFFAWCYSREQRPYYLLACTFAAGVAGAAKLFGLLLVIPLAIWILVVIVRSKRYGDLFWAAIPGGALCMFAAHWPYTMAWFQTGNPLFPFYNTVFQSPDGPLEDWINPLFNTPLTPEAFFRMSFDATPFMESAGVAFAPFIIIAPIMLVLAVFAGRAERRLVLTLALPVALAGLVYIVIAAQQQTYLRYFFPMVPMWAVAMGVLCIPLFALNRRVVAGVSLAALGALVTFQAVNGPGSFYFSRHLTPLQMAFSSTLRNVERTRAPERTFSQYLQDRTDRDEPVAYFWRSFFAGSTEGALAVHPWYSWTAWNDFAAAREAGDIMAFVNARGLRWLVVHESVIPHIGEATHEAINEIAEPELQLGGATLYRVEDDLFFNETIAEFDTPETLPEGWAPVGGVAVENGAIAVTREDLLVLDVPVNSDGLILVEAEVSCGEGALYAQLHMNWISAEGTFLHVDIPVFPCRSGVFPLRHEFYAPDGASQGVIVIDGPWGGTQNIYSFRARQNPGR